MTILFFKAVGPGGLLRVKPPLLVPIVFNGLLTHL
jgi:hypothetical protein